MLQYRHFRWDFPRGHIEAGETLEAVARREILEETGLKDFDFIPGFMVAVPWFYKRKNEAKPRFKEAVYFLAESKTKEVKLDFENLDFAWLPYDEARLLPSFPHVNEVLKKAHDFIAKRQADFD